VIENSFIFFPKIRKKKEEAIWKQGILNWDDFVSAENIKGISKRTKNYYDRQLIKAKHHLFQNPAWFSGKLPQTEIWRFYSYMQEEACFLDVEVDSYGKIILIGIADKNNFFVLVKKYNLTKNSLENLLKKYQMIITFNGGSFDLPKIKKQFTQSLPPIHLDLKPLCVNLGLLGGLKQIEKDLNLNRPEHLYGNPVDLWKTLHASQDKEYLDLLLEYNREDCENLQFLTKIVVQRMRAKVFKFLSPSNSNESNSLGS